MCSRITKVCAYSFQEIRKVVDEIGPEHIIHIVTDNGSNYQKACRQLKEVYEHIVWTPCLAHTVNLVLKDIGQRLEHCNARVLAPNKSPNKSRVLSR
jgi:hypothetical protein